MFRLKRHREMPFVVGEIPLRTLLFSNTDNARGMLLMSEVFATHLHSGKSCSIFALAREARKCFPFLVSNPPTDPQPPEGGFSFLLWEIVRPEWLCKRASLRFSFGPSELSSVAVLQGRSARVGKLIGLMRLMGRMR